jgi:hypothetical protein
MPSAETFRVGVTNMFLKLSCSLALFASVLLAQQQIQPGTVASTAAPDPNGAASVPGYNPATSSSSDAVSPVTAKQRLQWVLDSTFGPASLTAGLFSAGWGTLFDHPKTYGPHWEGFGDRYGMRLSGLALSNSMEAGLGALWGEDPRYHRVGDEAPFLDRLGHAAKMTFLAQNRAGRIMPAYARFIAIPSSNFISNAWRAPGDDTAGNAAVRIGLGFFGTFGGNTFDEFWPDVKHKLFH